MLLRRCAVEALGTAFLLAGVVGSGIMAERLSPENPAIALLANTLATGAALMCLIAALASISAAHLNPAVSFADAIRGGLPWRELPAYWFAQVLGAVGGVAAANVMFGLPAFSLSRHIRSGPALWFGEFVATFGLLIVIWGCTRARTPLTAAAVAAYIVAAYWFTSSTSFANPAVTIARSLSDTFAGIRPLDITPFVLAQFLGATCATLAFGWLAPIERQIRDTALPRDGRPGAVA
jgi:glycerol uptake facilitator-like aquaporin